MSEEKRAFAHEFWDCLSRGDFDRMAEIYDENVVYHAAGDERRVGRAAAVDFARAYKSAFPDLAASVELVLVDGDYVFTMVRVTGTHQGQLFDIAATGKAVDVQWVMNVVRLADGKVVEEWEVFDGANFAAQLGLA